MKQVRVLIMGSDRLADDIRRYLAKAGIELIDTSQTREDVYDVANERYVMTSELMQLVRDASRERYDVIIICNNRGNGLNFAVVIPEGMRAVTMIAWNEYLPGNEEVYHRLGFRDFGNKWRVTDDPDQLTVADFIIRIAATLP